MSTRAKVVVAAGIVAGGALFVLGAVLLWAMLVGYIDPKDKAANKKDVVQVYVLILAGVVAAITALVGLANLYFTRMNLTQQRALEDQRTQSTALQAYYEQMGKLLTEHDLLHTERADIRLLARAQTLTVLEGLDPPRKKRLLRFLVGSDLVQEREDRANSPLVDLTDTDLRGADLSGAVLREAYLRGARLNGANLSGADLSGADLSGALLRGAEVPADTLEAARSLEGATMPDGSTHD